MLDILMREETRKKKRNAANASSTFQLEHPFAPQGGHERKSRTRRSKQNEQDFSSSPRQLSEVPESLKGSTQQESPTRRGKAIASSAARNYYFKYLHEKKYGKSSERCKNKTGDHLDDSSQGSGESSQHGKGDKADRILVDSPNYFNLVFGLCQMFEAIDINGDGTMEWNEFMEFLRETIHQRT